MKIAVGSDRRGFAVQPQVAKVLDDLGHAILFVGSCEGQWKNYPEVASCAAGLVSRGEAERAILLASSGMGMCIVANKFPGVRAAVSIDDWTASMSRRCFDANVLCLSAEMLGDNQIASIIHVWLATAFEGGRHQRRIETIRAVETDLLKPATSHQGERERGTDPP